MNVHIPFLSLHTEQALDLGMTNKCSNSSIFKQDAEQTEKRVCYSEAGWQWQGYVTRTNGDNETGKVKNGFKSHQPQNWDRSEKVWWRQHTGLRDCIVIDKSPTASVLTKVKWIVKRDESRRSRGESKWDQKTTETKEGRQKRKAPKRS